ncbi:DUF6233 domain-containing protein [Streptomyces sp. NBC_01198]|uniref:DUF6233 domain-containing protein n=1 Tax=Streptomyces sp. NBC_01198 TaxID=2903769 RepID=UPI003FA36856
MTTTRRPAQHRDGASHHNRANVACYGTSLLAARWNGPPPPARGEHGTAAGGGGRPRTTPACAGRTPLPAAGLERVCNFLTRSRPSGPARIVYHGDCRATRDLSGPAGTEQARTVLEREHVTPDQVCTPTGRCAPPRR